MQETVSIGSKTQYFLLSPTYGLLNQRYRAYWVKDTEAIMSKTQFYKLSIKTITQNYCQSNFIISQTELSPLDHIDKVKQYICSAINKFIGLVSGKT